MSVKQRDFPIHLKATEALFRRLPQSHPKKAKIERDFLKRKAGYEGELKLDYPLSLLMKKNMIFC